MSNKYYYLELGNSYSEEEIQANIINQLKQMSLIESIILIQKENEEEIKKKGGKIETFEYLLGKSIEYLEHYLNELKNNVRKN